MRRTWYAGRMFGFCGRGVRSLYGIAVYDLQGQAHDSERNALERVEEHVQTGRDVDGARARLGIQAVDDAERRAQRAVGDAGLREQRLVVEDGSAGCRRQLRL